MMKDTSNGKCRIGFGKLRFHRCAICVSYKKRDSKGHDTNVNIPEPNTKKNEDVIKPEK